MQIFVKTILGLILLFGCSFLSAQESKNHSDLDVIYMKNGKIVKGIILKRELGVLTIKLTDSITHQEKTQIYQQNDIKKIIRRNLSKEIPQRKDSAKVYVEGGRNDAIGKSKNIPVVQTVSSDMPYDLLPELSRQSVELKSIVVPEKKMVQTPVLMPGPNVTVGEQLADPLDLVELHKAPKPLRKYRGWYRQIQGFRMFVDYGYMIGVGKTKNNRMEFATSLGYQFNPIFYTGIGTGGLLSMNDKDHSLPIFINGRMNFLDEYTTPYIDIKTGYSVAEGRGFYFSSSIGVSFTKKGKHAFNLGLTYTSQNVKYYEWQDKERIAIREAQHGLGMRLSLEF